eukprot:gene8521-9437_t
MTPNMLWLLGQQNYRPSERDCLCDSDLGLHSPLPSAAMHFEGPLPSSHYNSIEAINGTEVVVPELHFTLSKELTSILREEMDPLADSDLNRIDIYLRTWGIWRNRILTA